MHAVALVDQVKTEALCTAVRVRLLQVEVTVAALVTERTTYVGLEIQNKNMYDLLFPSNYKHRVFFP